MPQSMKQIIQRTRVFWGWEGISERNFGGYLQLIANDMGIPLHFDREHNLIGGGDPLTVVQQSVQVMLQSERRRGKYKHRAVLLDTDRSDDDQAKFVAAIDLCRKHRIDLLLQRENHEAMLCRHHEGHTNIRPSKSQSLRTLKRIWPDYEKSMSAQQLFARFGVKPLDFLFEGEQEICGFLRKIGLPYRNK